MPGLYGGYFCGFFGCREAALLHQSQVKPCDPMVIAPTLSWAFLRPKINFSDVSQLS